MTDASSGAVASPCLLSVVVPVFNEEETVGLFLESLAAPLAEARARLGPGGRTEIVFVDDGSRDATAERIGARMTPGSGIRLVRLSRNFGKDAALAAGLAECRGDAVVPMDVDLQDPPGLLPEMVEAWRAGHAVVNAVRADRSADTMLKRTTAALFYRLHNQLAAYPISPNVGDFRLLDRAVVDELNRMPERVRFMKGLVSWVGFRQAEVRYARDPRSVGQTKWRFWSLWNFALDGITGSTTLPLRIWSYVGSAVAVMAVLYALFIVVRTLFIGVEVPGYASLVTIVLIIGAINLIAIGIVGEYVGRIAIEVRQRPLYIVEGITEAAPPPASPPASGPGSGPEAPAKTDP